MTNRRPLLQGHQLADPDAPIEHPEISRCPQWLLWMFFILFNCKEKILVVFELKFNVLDRVASDGMYALFRRQLRTELGGTDNNFVELKGWCALEFYTENFDYKLHSHIDDDSCKEVCLESERCQGFQSIGDHCVEWIQPCFGSGSLGWHGDADSATMLSEEAYDLQSFWTTGSRVMAQEWNGLTFCLKMMYVGTFLQAVFALDMCMTFISCGGSRCFNTYSYLAHIVAVKKLPRMQNFFWFSAGLCLFYHAALWYFMLTGFCEFSWEVVMTPLLALLNVWDIRKVNYNLYPDGMFTLSEEEEAHLNMDFNLAFCPAEELLVLVENAALAQQQGVHAERKRLLMNIVRAEGIDLQARDEDRKNNVDRIIKQLKRMGTDKGAADLLKGTEDSGKVALPRWCHSISALVQLKPYVLVCIGSLQLITKARAAIIPYGRASMANNFIDWWVLLFKSFIILFSCFGFKNILTDNMYEYGTLQFFWRIVQLKRAWPFFKSFFMFIFCYITFIWVMLGASNLYIVGGRQYDWSAICGYVQATCVPLLLIIVNAVQTRRVAPSLYPIDMPTEAIRLKLLPWSSMWSFTIPDIFTPAEEVLERLESAYIVKNFVDPTAAQQRFFDCILDQKAKAEDGKTFGEHVEEVYASFGKEGSDKSVRERREAAKVEQCSVDMVFASAIFTSIVAFAWELLIPAIIEVRLPPRTPLDQFSSPLPIIDNFPDADATPHDYLGSFVFFLFTAAWVVPCGCFLGIVAPLGRCARAWIAHYMPVNMMPDMMGTSEQDEV